MKSVPSNYGYVFFGYGCPDEKALENHYANYISKEEFNEIEKARKEDAAFGLGEYLEDCLFSKVCISAVRMPFPIPFTFLDPTKPSQTLSST
ncbi:MAG: hypothetical protein ABIH76_02800 [Candidatus Bathyarchaeota archaeon]